MARKSKTEEPATNGIAPPAGFTKRSASKDAAWVHKAPGSLIFGLIEGRYPKSVEEGEPPKHYYQVRLYKECEIVLKGGVIETAERGDLVNLDEIGALKGLPDALAAGERVVWCHLKEKKKQTKNAGKTFWDAEVYTSSDEQTLSDL
jgi:hypothetical protein